MNLEDLKRLEQAATPPPWCVAPGSFNTLVLSPGKVTIASLGWNTRQVDRMHAAYIAAARNALPALLRVAEAAREWERVTTEHVNGTADEVIAARRAARAELRAALDGWCEVAEHEEAEMAQQDSEIVKLRAQNERLREVSRQLLDYVEHDSQCSSVRWQDARCDCGLPVVVAAARAALEAAR